MKLVTKNHVTFSVVGGILHIAAIDNYRLVAPVRLNNITNVDNVVVARGCAEDDATETFVIWVSDNHRYTCSPIGDDSVSVKLLDNENRVLDYDLINTCVMNW